MYHKKHYSAVRNLGDVNVIHVWICETHCLVVRNLGDDDVAQVD